jgi:hypothetical protein
MITTKNLIYKQGQRPKSPSHLPDDGQSHSNAIYSSCDELPNRNISSFKNKYRCWELIDGLQRLSTILEFMGKLRGPEGATILGRAISLPFQERQQVSIDRRRLRDGHAVREVLVGLHGSVL